MCSDTELFILNQRNFKTLRGIMAKNLHIRKPVEAFHEDMKNSGLKRVLGKWGLAGIGIGAIIGAGIFVLTGLGARDHAGPALALSFVIAGIGCTFAALCYAEFASFLPVEGSAYAYAYATLGEFFAWIIGWDLILEYAMASATVAVGWSGYLVKFLNLFSIKLPFWLANDYFTASGLLQEAMTKPEKMTELTNHFSQVYIPNFAGIPFSINLLAFLAVLGVTAILVRGIKEAANTNVLMVIIKLAVVLFIIIVGANYVNPANWFPFIPERELITNIKGLQQYAYGYAGIVTGAAYIFFAYIGFDSVSTQAGEAINPQKDVPFGIIVSLVVCTILYILVALVLTGMVPFKEIDIHAPIASAFSRYELTFAVAIISFAAIAGLTSVLIVMLLGQSRVLFAMAKDGLIPKNLFGELHPKYRTPYKSSILTGIIVALVAANIPIEIITELVNIGTLLAFVIVCASVWMMRYIEPDRPRPFRTPLIKIVAPLGIIFNLGMMLYLGWHNWARLGIWLVIGAAIYFFYSQHHSILRKNTK